MTRTPHELVERFYENLWNRWDFDCASDIVAEDISFRGSLGRETLGRREFLRYVRDIHASFPDWHNQ